MASTIRIKRSATSGNPTTLAQGELAYSYTSPASGGDRLYVGTGTETAGDAVNHEVIGGKFYVDLLGGASGPTLGTVTASQAVTVDASKKVNEWLIDNVSIDGNTISSTSGNLIFSAAGDINFSGETLTNLGAPSVGSDAATKSYVDGIVGGDSITLNLNGDTGSGAIALANSDLTLTGGTGIASVVSDNTVTFNLSNVGTAGTYGSASQIPQITTNAQGQVTGVTELSVDIPATFTVNGDPISLNDSDITFAAGEGLDLAVNTDTNTFTFSGENASTSNKGIASFATADFSVSSGAVSIKSGGVSNTQLENSSITVTAGNGLTGGGTPALGGSTSLAIQLDGGSASGLEVDGSGLNIAASGVSNAMLANDTITIGSTGIALGATSTTLAGLTSLTVDNMTLDGNAISTSTGSLILDPTPAGSSGEVIILGDLTVQGTTTTINSTTVTVNDLNITLADSATNNVEANGAGITVNGSNATITYASTGDKWTMNKTLDVPGLLIDGADLGNFVDSEVADLLLAGEGIDLVYTGVGGSLTISGENATTSNLGIASFGGLADSAGGSVPQFAVTSGDVEIINIDGGTY
jgi:hypothetical protein